MLRRPLIDAVAAFQRPVTTPEVLRAHPNLAGSALSLTRLCKAVAELGPDERGRRLARAHGCATIGTQLWTVLPPPELAPLPPSLRASIADRAAALALPGEGLADVLDRALASLEAERTQ